MSETIYEDEEPRERAVIGIEKKKLGARQVEARRDRIWEGRTE